jgi:hypothetical protein
VVSTSPVELPLPGAVEVVSVGVPVDVERVAPVVGGLVVGGSVLVVVGEPAVSRSTGPPPESPPE